MVDTATRLKPCELNVLDLDGARWFDPTVGRWLIEDPSGLSPDSNPYRYAGNAPTNQSDPTGLKVYLGSGSVSEKNTIGEPVAVGSGNIHGSIQIDADTQHNIQDEQEWGKQVAPGGRGAQLADQFGDIGAWVKLNDTKKGEHPENNPGAERMWVSAVDHIDFFQTGPTGGPQRVVKDPKKPHDPNSNPYVYQTTGTPPLNEWFLDEFRKTPTTTQFRDGPTFGYTDQIMKAVEKTGLTITSQVEYAVAIIGVCERTKEMLADPLSTFFYEITSKLTFPTEGGVMSTVNVAVSPNGAHGAPDWPKLKTASPKNGQNGLLDELPYKPVKRFS